MTSGRGILTEHKKYTQNFSMKSEGERPFGRDGRKTVGTRMLMVKECPFVGHESTWWSEGLAPLTIKFGAIRK